jgi:hypothetical protein
LRNRALRRLWVSNPVLANLDGLVDYADDFTKSSRSGPLATTYQVGKGLARHIEQLAREADAAAEDKAGSAFEPTPEPEVEPEIRQEESEKNLRLSGGCGDPAVEQPDPDVRSSLGIPSRAEDGGGTAVRRRMSFSFDEDDRANERPDPDRTRPAKR